MKLTRGIFLAGFLTILGGACVGCCPSNKKKGEHKKTKQEVTVNISCEPQTLDPRKVRGLGDINLAKNLMEGLMRTDASGTTTKGVAESINVSPDGKTYTFTLKETKWSNGDPVRAQDFVYAMKKALSPEFLSDNAFLLYSIKNAKSVKGGTLPSSMLGVRALTDYTLEVQLEYPVPYFLEMLTHPIYFPVHQKIDQATPDWAHSAATFVSNGPFKLAKWEHNFAIELEKNTEYWDKKEVQLDKIHMIMVDAETGLKMFQNHEIDWEGSPYSMIPLDALPSLKEQNLVHTDPMLGTYWIRTNTSLYPFHSKEVRKALSLAINRSEIVDQVLEGMYIPATGIVPMALGIQTAPYFVDGDQAEAKEHLRIALEEENLRLDQFPPLTLTYISDTKNHRIAQALQNQWREHLGIEVRLEPLEPKVYYDRIGKSDYQLACGSWIADYRDPINFLEVFKSKTVGTNNTNWESLDYQKALEESYWMTSQEERKNLLQKSEKILMEDSPVIPIYHYTMQHVVSDHLRGVVLTDTGHIDFKWAHVE